MCKEVPAFEALTLKMCFEKKKGLSQISLSAVNQRVNTKSPRAYRHYEVT